MTLKHFKNIEKVNDQPIKLVSTQFELLDRVLEDHIIVDDRKAVVAFKLQDGPIKEYGKNGVQIDDVLAFCRQVIHNFNKDYPCEQNLTAILSIDCALDALEDRRKDREQRNVEGQNKL